MSILITGMEMPAGCPFCPLSHWTRGTDEFAGCNIVPGKRFAMLNDKAFAESPAKSRPDWCPLIELPPHGDLIDRDALMRKKIRSVQSGSGENFTSWTISAVSIENIRNSPTIIEAEEAEL